MAVVSYQRVMDGTDISGKYGESFQVTERWQVRCNSPLTSKMEILNSVVPARYGTVHPEVPGIYAHEVDASPLDRDGMLWMVTAKFYIPKRPKQANGLPADEWVATGGTTTVPCYIATDGTTITNSAGDPLEGLQMERDERTWELTKSYTTHALCIADRDSYSGTVNSTSWSGGGAKTWKATFKSARKKSIHKYEGDSGGDKIEYVEAVWEFRYEPLSWKMMPWNVGFMELVSGQRKAILGSDGKPVKQPVALNPDGTKRTDGQKPLVINYGNGVDIYGTSNFTTAFGDPALL